MPEISELFGIIKIIDARYEHDYVLRLTFNNGEVRIADLESSLVGEVFLPLRDIEMFKRFTIKFGTVTWENEADLAPEYLYEFSKAA